MRFERSQATKSLLTAAVALVFSAALAAQAAEPPRIGTKAPAFSIADENGKLHQLSDYRGKLVVLEWTNQECPYVKRHYRADTMEQLAKKLETEVVWLAVNSTRDNLPADTQTWKQEQGFGYPTLQDPDGKLGHLYGARTTPNLYVIDGEGVLRYSGAIDDDPRGRAEEPLDYVGGAVHAVLAGTNPDPSSTRPYGCSVKYQ